MAAKTKEQKLKAHLDELNAEIEVLKNERDEVTNAYLAEVRKRFPVGTEVVIYGKVEEQDEIDGTFRVVFPSGDYAWVSPVDLLLTSGYRKIEKGE